MASMIVFDPVTGHTKSITIEVQGTIIIQDLDADVDYYVQLSTSARKVSGAAIVPRIIRDVTPDDLTTKIEENIRAMINYGGGPNAMDFSS